MDARCAVFRVPALCGTEQDRKQCLVCIVRNVRHMDSQVRCSLFELGLGVRLAVGGRVFAFLVREAATRKVLEGPLVRAAFPR